MRVHHQHRRYGLTATKTRAQGATNLHQQTGLATGTVADDDELSADFSHGVLFVVD